MINVANKFKNPWLILEHGWGKSPEQKAKEKAYNHEYYLKNKNKWKTLYNDTENTHRSTVDSLDKSIAGAEARVSATKDSYDKASENYRKAISDYQEFLETIPKVGSQRTREQNRMLEDRQKKVAAIREEYEKVAKTYESAQNDLKSQMSERDRAQTQINRMKQRADRAQSEYDAYENSEAGESERFKREMKGLKTNLSKQKEVYERNYGDYARKSREIGDKIQKNAWIGDEHYSNVKAKNASEAQTLAAKKRRDKALWNQLRIHKRGENDERANTQLGELKSATDIAQTEREMQKRISKRRASAMARSAQAQQQKTQENRQNFQKQQRAIEQQANRDISTQKQRADSIQRQMKATQDRVSKLMEDLSDGMSKGYSKKDSAMQRIANQIKNEQNKLAQQRQQLDTINTAIKTLEKKAKKASGNI